jgi:hypothetical protein
MKNPPDFVMYVVMVKAPGSDKFDPCWGEWAEFGHGVHAKGFARKLDAVSECKVFRVRYGKKNAYVQQYGPIS